MADAPAPATATESKTPEHIVREWAATSLGNSQISADPRLWKIVQDALPSLIEKLSSK